MIKTGDTIAIKAENNRWLSRIHTNGLDPIWASKEYIDASCLFTVHIHDDLKVSLKASNNRWLSVIRRNSANPIEAAKEEIDVWCKFDIEYITAQDKSYVAFRGANNKWVSRIYSRTNDLIRADKDQIDESCLFTLHDMLTPTSWMKSLPDNYLLSQLSVPGSHNAGALYEPWFGTAQCQSLTIAEQLNAGIRFLDIRCRHVNDAFNIHHGRVYQRQNFDDVLNACFSFLTSHPGECIIMSVKEEHTDSNITRTFEQTFDAYTAKNPSHWYLGAGIPTLGSVRGKIVLLRRFQSTTTPKGIAANPGWMNNTTFTIDNGAESKLRVQDNFKVQNNYAKWVNVTNLLTEAKSGTSTTLYINFTSGFNPLFGLPRIRILSNYINPRIASYFTSNTQGRFGIIPMDFSDVAAVLIAQTNF
jgi:1-phosphatidylinositol phosphodiesterase